MRRFCSMIILLLVVTACNPVTVEMPASPPPANTAPALVPSTSTFSPTIVTKIQPTLPAPPTAIALRSLHPGQPLTLASIDMIDEQNGWGIDGQSHILRTGDGGYTWKDVTPYYPYIKASFLADGFFALDENTAWATARSMPACAVENFNCILIPNTSLIWHTTDGGSTWQGGFICLQSIECDGFPLVVSEDHVPMSLQFIDEQVGWLLVLTFDGFAYRYRLYQTTDGGSHWSGVMDRPNLDSPSDSQQKNVIGLGFQDARTGWMSVAETVGASPAVAEWNLSRSTDAGRTWVENSLPMPDTLPEGFEPEGANCSPLRMKVLSPDSIDVLFHCFSSSTGDAGHTFYFHFHSYDGGTHWVSWSEASDLQFVDGLLGWRLLPNGDAFDLERTQDGGVSWTKMKTVNWRGTLEFVNERVGWILADNYTDDAVALVHSTNSGKGWDEIHPVVAAP